jgi:hypothetical protein
MEAPWTPVIVTWRDAYSPDHRRSKDLLRHKIDPCIRRTIGFLIRDDEENVVVAMEDDREARDAINTDDDLENPTIIPRGMVVKMEELTVRRKRAEDVEQL